MGLSSRASWLAIGLGIVLAKIKGRAEVILRSRLDGHERANGHRKEDGDQEGNVVTGGDGDVGEVRAEEDGEEGRA